jgi:ferredoxin-NADP reductase
VLQETGAGVLVASITGAGVREWRFYSIGPDAFMDALNTALEQHPEYPLEFEAFEDPDWNALAELLPE